MTDTTAPPKADTDTIARKFTMTIDLDATPEEVWSALTNAEELVRWFPVQARVTPEPGGTMFWGWDDQFSWESTIAVWEPSKRLILTEDRPATDVKGAPLGGPSRKIAMEFTLETHAGRTRLRLVHSGFGSGASWDDELDAISGGWQFELRGLAFYLERHKGRDRVGAAVHRTTSTPRDVIWSRLFSHLAFAVEGRLEPGERCSITTSVGDRVSGKVLWFNPGRDLAVVVDDFDQGLLRVSTWSAADQTGVQVWMITYAPEHTDAVTRFGKRIEPVVESIL
jgi:uncharacterized protein YndB with AHSA1/START domain